MPEERKPSKPRKTVLPAGRPASEAERSTTSMALPLPVHHRLDEMVQLARGARTNRAEMIAALISGTELEPDELETLVLNYRKLSVGEVMGTSDATNVTVLRHGPGRRGWGPA